MADRKSFPLRIEPELYRQLEEWAQQELRSVNGQIEFLLKQAVEKRKKPARGGFASEQAIMIVDDRMGSRAERISFAWERGKVRQS